MAVVRNVTLLKRLVGILGLLPATIITAIAKEMSYASGLQKQALFSIALVLFLFIMLINVVLNIVLKGGSRNE